MSVKVKFVRVNTVSQKLGIKEEDVIISVQGEEIDDYLDLAYRSSDLDGEIIWISGKDKKKADLSEVEPGPFGVQLYPLKIRRCNNRCIFCFVDQNPSNLRKSLYFKDDDYRLSFLDGAYITTTNLNKRDIEKILEMKLSPLYISVHSTDPEIRSILLGNKEPSPIIPLLKKITDAGINLHTQIVIVPEVNGGMFLERTIEDLLKLNVSSISLVPVGITRYRSNLFSLRSLMQEEAFEIVEMAFEKSRKIFKKRSRNIIYTTDNMFLLAETEIPHSDYYDDFPQLENGVGGVRIFLDELEKIRPLNEGNPIFLLTGVSMFPFVEKLAERLSSTQRSVKAVYVENKFLGKSVRTAGLMSGSDIIRTIANLDEGDIYLPERSLNKDKLFIDDISYKDLIERTGRSFFLSPVSAVKLFEKINKE